MNCGAVLKGYRSWRSFPSSLSIVVSISSVSANLLPSSRFQMTLAVSTYLKVSITVYENETKTHLSGVGSAHSADERVK